jgi:hypothetical protein
LKDGWGDAKASPLFEHKDGGQTWHPLFSYMEPGFMALKNRKIGG